MAAVVELVGGADVQGVQRDLPVGAHAPGHVDALLVSDARTGPPWWSTCSPSSTMRPGTNTIPCGSRRNARREVEIDAGAGGGAAGMSGGGDVSAKRPYRGEPLDATVRVDHERLRSPRPLRRFRLRRCRLGRPRVGFAARRDGDAVKGLLESLGEDPKREGLLLTPMRVAKSLRFLTAGYQQDAEALLRAPSSRRTPTRWWSSRTSSSTACASTTCCPFFGRAHVAYLPSKRSSGCQQARARRRRLREAPAGAGATDHPDRRRDPRRAPTARRGGPRSRRSTSA